MPSPFITSRRVVKEAGAVLARAAYNRRTALTCPRTGATFDWSAVTDWQAGGLAFPREAGPQPPGLARFWSIADASRPAGSQQTAIELLLGLPHRDELEPSEMAALVQAFIAPIVAAGHPVQWDIHAPGPARATHAHLLVSVHGIDPAWRMVPIANSPFRPAVRRGTKRFSVTNVGWREHWRGTQEAFYRDRAMPLRVPATATAEDLPPPDLAEPETRTQDLEAYRAARRAHFMASPDRVHRALVRDRTVFDRHDVRAFLRVVAPDLDGRALDAQASRVLADAVVVGERPGLYSTRAALDRLAQAWRLAHELRRSRYAGAGRGGDDPVSQAHGPERLAVLEGATLRALLREDWSVGGAGPLPELLSQHLDRVPLTLLLPDLAARRRHQLLVDDPDNAVDLPRADVSAWLAGRAKRRPGALVVVADAQRMDDVRLAAVLAEVSRSGGKLVLSIDASDPVAPGRGDLACALAKRFGGGLVLERDGLRNAITIPVWPAPGALRPERGGLLRTLNRIQNQVVLAPAPGDAAGEPGHGAAPVIVGDEDEARRILARRALSPAAAPAEVVTGWADVALGVGSEVVLTRDLAAPGAAPLGTVARITGIDGGGRVVAIDTGGATRELVEVDGGRVPLASVSVLPLRLAGQLGGRPYEVRIDGVAHALPLIAHAAGRADVTIRVAADVASSLGALADRLGRPVLADALEAIGEPEPSASPHDGIVATGPVDGLDDLEARLDRLAALEPSDADFDDDPAPDWEGEEYGLEPDEHGPEPDWDDDPDLDDGEHNRGDEGHEP